MTKVSKKHLTPADAKPVLPAVFGYHIFPPFIDAYMQSFWDEIQLPLSEIESKMKSHAWEWGKEVVGESILRGRQLPKFNDKIVLCCAYTYTGKDNDSYKHYLVVVDEFCNEWDDKLQFIEGRVNDEWDVT